jgi:acetyl-CoA acetyltransferase
MFSQHWHVCGFISFNSGREHMAKYGTTAKQFAMIGEKNHRHSANNPYAQFRDKYSLEQIESAPMTYEPLTKLQCSPTSDGAGAAIVCSEEFVKKHGLEGQAIEIMGQSMRTDAAGIVQYTLTIHSLYTHYPLTMRTDAAESFTTELHDRSCIDMIGAPMAKNCADEVYAMAGMTADDVQVRSVPKYGQLSSPTHSSFTTFLSHGSLTRCFHTLLSRAAFTRFSHALLSRASPAGGGTA